MDPDSPVYTLPPPPSKPYSPRGDPLSPPPPSMPSFIVPVEGSGGRFRGGHAVDNGQKLIDQKCRGERDNNSHTPYPSPVHPSFECWKGEGCDEESACLNHAPPSPPWRPKNLVNCEDPYFRVLGSYIVAGVGDW